MERNCKICGLNHSGQLWYDCLDAVINEVKDETDGIPIGMDSKIRKKIAQASKETLHSDLPRWINRWKNELKFWKKMEKWELTDKKRYNKYKTEFLFNEFAKDEKLAKDKYGFSIETMNTTRINYLKRRGIYLDDTGKPITKEEKEELNRIAEEKRIKEEEEKIRKIEEKLMQKRIMNLSIETKVMNVEFGSFQGKKRFRDFNAIDCLSEDANEAPPAPKFSDESKDQLKIRIELNEIEQKMKD